jgi:hypothetical protein
MMTDVMNAAMTIVMAEERMYFHDSAATEELASDQ